MEKIQESFDVGVIVGRFQVDELTKGHKDLIMKVRDSHKRTIIVLGLSPCKCTINNPLDFQTRKTMIQEVFPEVEVFYINDVSSDIIWSDALDKKITDVKGNSNGVCLYGSRDSFLQYYSGIFPCREVLQEVFVSGTERRKELAKKINKSKDFRHGAIWAVNNQWPANIPTIDAAIFNVDCSRILLARKPKEDLYRFVGGFVGPGETFEFTVMREIEEETHLTVEEMSYVKSFVINDWRYKNEVNKITTSLFKITKWNGTPEPDDDIELLRWFPFNTHLLDSIVVEHREMLDYLLNN